MHHSQFGERLVEKTERCFGQPFRLGVVSRGDHTKERFLLLRDPPGVLGKMGLRRSKALSAERGPNLGICSLASFSRVDSAVARDSSSESGPFSRSNCVFEKRLPVRSLFDRFEANHGRAGRHANFDRETAVAGERKIAKRVGPDPAVPDRNARGALCFRSWPAPRRSVFPLREKHQPLMKRISRLVFHSAGRSRAKVRSAFAAARCSICARAIEKLPKWLDRFPGRGALNLLEQTLAALQARCCFSAFGL